MKNTQNKTSAPLESGSTRRVDEPKEARQPVSQLKHGPGQNANPAEDVAIVPLSEKEELLVTVRKELCLTLRGKPDQGSMPTFVLSGDALRWMFNRKV